jgi:8-oxo-dGTP pyrophosphatase MutT (NUDIX family)
MSAMTNLAPAPRTRKRQTAAIDKPPINRYGTVTCNVMQWHVHGERTLYDSEWVRLALTDVEIPAIGTLPAKRFEHHVVRMPAPATGVVVFDPNRGVLLLWRHRFITNSWGWEVPAGKVDEGEDALTAAAREVLEETGYRSGPLTHMCTYHPVSGVGDHRFVLYFGDGAEHIGEPSDPAEAERIEWVPVEKLRAEIAAGRVDNGLTLTAVLWCFTYGLFEPKRNVSS